MSDNGYNDRKILIVASWLWYLEKNTEGELTQDALYAYCFCMAHKGGVVRLPFWDLEMSHKAVKLANLKYDSCKAERILLAAVTDATKPKWLIE